MEIRAPQVSGADYWSPLPLSPASARPARRDPTGEWDGWWALIGDRGYSCLILLSTKVEEKHRHPVATGEQAGEKRGSRRGVKQQVRTKKGRHWGGGSHLPGILRG